MTEVSRNSSLIHVDNVLNFFNSSGDPNYEEVKAVLEQSTNGMGELGLEQATEILTKNSSSDNEDVREAFKAYDTNKDGFIDESELVSAFIRLKIDISENEIQQIFKNICQTGDKKITFDQFKNLLGY